MLKLWKVALVTAGLLLVSCGAPKTEPLKKYQMKGEVLGVDATAHTAKIKHEKIEGWMDAMTMDYPIKDDAELKKLATGQPITATVFVQGQDYWVGDIATH
jgi:Cu/Ag efflux protein CusF